MAVPKQRSQEEVDQVFDIFKRGFKEVCDKHKRSQYQTLMRKFIRDIFDDQQVFFEYLRTGTCTGLHG